MKRWTLIAMVLAIIAMIAGTLLEKYNGSAFALTHIYSTPWFMGLLVVIAALGATIVWQHRLYRRIATAGIHLALVLIVAGIVLTTFTARSGRLVLQKDQPTNTFEKIDNGRSRGGTLPFDVKLINFDIINYPGTQSPADFVTQVLFLDPDGTTAEAQISMNKIARHHGYRFYQAGFDNDGHDFLTVAHDPWGITCTYAGYAILALSFIGFFFDKHSRFRELLSKEKSDPPSRKNIHLPAIALAVFLAASTATSVSAKEAPMPRTLTPQQADQLGNLYVLYNDRVCPLQTLATDFTTKLYGKPNYRGLSANQVFAGWIFYYSDWSTQPIFKIKGDAVRKTLGIDGKYATLNDFISPQGTNKLAQPIETLDFTNPLRNKYLAADEKYNLVAMLYGGQLLKLFPIADSTGSLGWYSQSDHLPSTVDGDEYLFIRMNLSYMQECLVFGKTADFDTVLVKLRKYQERKAGNLLPSSTRFAAEKMVNTLNFSRLLAMLFITIGLIAFAFSIVRTAQGRQIEVWMRVALILLLALLAAYLLLLFVLRWVVAGHVPLSNGYETMLFLSLCTAILALSMQRRQPLTLTAGTLLVGFMLLVAMIGGSNPSITQLMPVLNSPLMSIHVATIMVAYSLLAFAMLCGVGGLILINHHDATQRLQRVSQLLLYPAVFLLVAGVFIGALWANISWGTYWSWDPKETWALITLLIYALPLHTRSFAWLNNPRNFHLYMVLAFLSVLITYFGVNLLLGGMHSYA